jgi:hypothetical protein
MRRGLQALMQQLNPFDADPKQSKCIGAESIELIT